jgi:4-amino-4-deoxy-L-arabinose transferase-like glycosyltransferase
MKRDIAQPDIRTAIPAPRAARPAIQRLNTHLQALNWPLLLIVVAGVALRLWLISVSPLDARFSNADDGDYYRRALRFALTGQYIDDSWLIRPPLHVLFFALWIRVAIAAGWPQLSLLLIQLAQTVLGALTIILGYGVARRLFSSTRAGFLFAAFLACWFPFVEQPVVLFSELLYSCLFLLHMWFLLRFDTSNRPRDLACSGLALGAAALTRSPALYSLAFVVVWLLIRRRTKDEGRRTKDQRPMTDEGRRTKDDSAVTLSPCHLITLSRGGGQWSVISQALLVVICCLAVVGPWTIRNALLYRRFIPVDTLGPINLWLDLDEVSKRNQHIDDLRQLPQADRQSYASARVREILTSDPLRPFRDMWPTFRHIWKAQYVEDLFVKQSFFGRPLRAAAPLGLPGDILWLVYTLAGLIGLAAPPREGLHNRLFVLAWLGYSLVTVLVFHVEPRYLLPIWLLIGLYGAWALARGRSLLAELGIPLHGLIAATLTLAFLALVLTYRNYPSIIANGLARERAIVAGERAYAAGDYADAERAFRAGLAIQPGFVDGQVDLALALAAQGRRAEAAAVLTRGGSRQADFLAGVLARNTHDSDAVRVLLARSEATAGENIQQWAREWLRLAPTSSLTLGNGLDLGYIQGFSGPESGPIGTFRWLEGAGQIVLSPPKSLGPGAALVLHIAGGRPGLTPLEVRIGDDPARHIQVQSGQWRVYRLPLTPGQLGRRPISVELRAPTFAPTQLDATNNDLRMLSLMISEVSIE